MLPLNPLLTINTIKAIQQELECNNQGFVASENKGILAATSLPIRVVITV